MKSKSWINISDIIPPVGLVVECYRHDGSVYSASLFDIDHSTSDVVVRFLVSGSDKIQFASPKLWRFRQKQDGQAIT